MHRRPLLDLRHLSQEALSGQESRGPLWQEIIHEQEAPEARSSQEALSGQEQEAPSGRKAFIGRRPLWQDTFSA